MSACIHSIFQACTIWLGVAFRKLLCSVKAMQFSVMRNDTILLDDAPCVTLKPQSADVLAHQEWLQRSCSTIGGGNYIALQSGIAMNQLFKALHMGYILPQTYKYIDVFTHTHLQTHKFWNIVHGIESQGMIIIPVPTKPLALQLSMCSEHAYVNYGWHFSPN